MGTAVCRGPDLLRRDEDARPIGPVHGRAHLNLNPASLAAPLLPLPPTERHRHPRYFRFGVAAGRSWHQRVPRRGAARLVPLCHSFFARMPIFLGGCVPWQWEWEWEGVAVAVAG